MFFIFQLPFTKVFFLKYAPMLFNTDGNYNLYGYISTSICFGILYYVITYVLDYYSDVWFSTKTALGIGGADGDDTGE